MKAMVDEDYPRRLGELGLSEAVERLRPRLGNGSLEPPGAGYLVPFGECLHWTYSLYELAEDRMFGERPRKERKKLFEEYNSRTTAGQILRAVVWARATLAHELLSPPPPDLAPSGSQGAGMLGTAMLGEGPGAPIWIMVNPDERAEDVRRGVYEQLVVGRPAIEPLEAVSSYLIGLP